MIATDTSIYEKVFTEFVGTDGYRPALMKPRKVGNYVYATNAHVLIRFDASKVPSQFYNEQDEYKYPDVESLIDKYLIEFDKNQRSTLSLERISNGLKGMKRTPIYGDCSFCEGHGTIECQCCWNESDCEECNGTGETDEIVGYYIQYQKYVFELSDNFIDPNLLLKVATACDLLGIETLQSSSNPSKTVLLKNDDVVFLVVPLFEHSPTGEVVKLN